MSCRVEARHRAHNAVNELEAIPAVVGVDVVAPSVDPTDRWTVEVTLRTDGIPPVVSGIFGEHSLTLSHAGPRGDWWHGLAVVDR
ncbi:hypothetical protein ACFR9U_15895 [Halorientalis brevis]|uniref:Uncharacterized protein n=1 Tax=Halorientalis brevis TaxID=1126241 RepID=A0ABD6CGW2_9EURY|nr:hypothetical protein [Halorientalis brevis]